MRSKIFDLIDESKSIVLLTHENPDGDAIGSVMAVYHYLKSINKSVDIVVKDVPLLFSFLKDIDKIVDNSDKEYDLAIILDCSTEKRVNQGIEILDKCKRKIVIDHHVSNTEYGDINHICGEEPACCQIVYYLFKDNNILIDKVIGENLMTGLLTDTNGFRNNNVNKRSFLMAADMIDYGVNIYMLYDTVLARKNRAQHELMKIALDRLEFYEDGKIAFSYITRDDMESVSARVGDHEGLVDLGRSIDGVEVSIFMREEDGYRISFRSNGIVDVNEIASVFGGGGHKMAAGAKIEKDLQETKKILIDETIRIFKQ